MSETTPALDELDCQMEPEARCPYCGRHDSDSWEIFEPPGMDGRSDTVECGWCGEEFIVTENLQITYSTKKRSSG